MNRRMEPPGGPAAKAARPLVGVPFLNHHPIILPLETFLVGIGEREGEEKVGTVFPNSAEHFTFFQASRAGVRVGEALLQLLSFLCTNSQKDLLFYENILHLGLKGATGVYSAQRYF